MSYEPANHPIELRQIATGALIGLGAQRAFADDQRLRKLIAVLIVASAVTACAGGAGLDMPIGPIDHGCHNGTGVVLEREGSGCS